MADGQALNEPDITIDTGITITSASTANIKYLKPDGVSGGTFTGAVSGTQLIAYTAQAGELDQPGIWTLQGHVVLSNGKTFHTPLISHTFNSNLTGA